VRSSSGSDRPRHSNLAAFLRSKQMSKRELFVFVEGNENDAYFYGNLCSSVTSSTGVSFQICSSKQIPDSSGGTGKTGLISLFHYLRQASSLLSDLNGKKTAFLFFLDKDVDDLLDALLASDHVIYTHYYDVENHIVQHGDLKRGCAAAASMDPQEIDICFGNPAAWLRDAAEKWKEWVIFCVFVKASNLENCPLNYSRPSQINNPVTGALNQAAYAEKLASLEADSGLSRTDFRGQFERISTLVDNLYQTGEYGKVFKGKWYKYFLAAEIRGVAGTACGDLRGIERQVLKHIAATLDFSAEWTDHFKRPVRIVVDKLGAFYFKCTT